MVGPPVGVAFRRNNAVERFSQSTTGERSMRIITLLAAIIGGAFLFGCATTPAPKNFGRPPPFGVASQDCSDSCVIEIRVKSCTSDNIKARYFVAKLGTGSGGTNREIIWVILDKGYRFSTST